jgi:hypothetical protein
MGAMEKIEQGAMARTTQAWNENGYNYAEGLEFQVEYYATAEEADSDDGMGYYLGNRDGGFNNVEVREDHIELVRSAQEMGQRKLPTPQEVAEVIADEVMGFNDLNIDEADYSDPNGSLELVGTTPEGLRFVAYVKVLAIDHADY